MLALCLVTAMRGACWRPPSYRPMTLTDRTVLPIPKPQSLQITEIDARKVKAPPQFQVKATKGAPNVVIVLIDDMGFGHASHDDRRRHKFQLRFSRG